MAQDPQRLRVGLIVNPVSGLGGPGGFKGSDLNWKDALEAGYKPTAPDRARRFVQLVGAHAAWWTVPGIMGLDEAPGAKVVLPEAAFALGVTSAADTGRAAQALRDAGIELL